MRGLGSGLTAGELVAVAQPAIASFFFAAATFGSGSPGETAAVFLGGVTGLFGTAYGFYRLGSAESDRKDSADSEQAATDGGRI